MSETMKATETEAEFNSFLEELFAGSTEEDGLWRYRSAKDYLMMSHQELSEYLDISEDVSKNYASGKTYASGKLKYPVPHDVQFTVMFAVREHSKLIEQYDTDPAADPKKLSLRLQRIQGRETIRKQSSELLSGIVF